MLLASSSTADQHRAIVTAAASASSSQTSTVLQPSLRLPRTSQPDGTLRLRGGPIEDRRVRWDQDVIDNEGMGKKKSKVCCIYHRPRTYDESSSEEDSSSDESSSDDSDDSNHHNHHPDSGSSPRRCNHMHGDKSSGMRRKNAYEKMPKSNSGLKRQT